MSFLFEVNMLVRLPHINVRVVAFALFLASAGFHDFMRLVLLLDSRVTE